MQIKRDLRVLGHPRITGVAVNNFVIPADKAGHNVPFTRVGGGYLDGMYVQCCL